MDHDIDRLVKRAQSGDQFAFGVIVEGHDSKIRGLLLGIVHNPHDADELAQQTWIKAWRNLPKFEGRSSFSTWLFRIATFTAWDHLKKEKRRAEIELAEEVYDSAVEYSATPINTPARPDEAAAHAEVRERFKSALGSLSDKHRATLVLREVEGLSYKEIATVLDCNVGTVMSRIHTARKSIQAKMKDLL